MNFEVTSIQADHKDLIHDVAYDFYGRRLATCSSDQSVKVWDLDDNNQWVCSASWKTHSGSVWKVTWAHPDFGQVLATCSFDRTTAIWEELIADGSSSDRNRSCWTKRTTLVDSRTSVTDVKFAPKHLGLLLANCSSDVILRIYEAPDVMNLGQWSLQHDIVCKMSCSSLSWNPSRMHPPMIAVGCDEECNQAKIIIFEYSENTRQWFKTEEITNVIDPVHDLAFAPNVGRSYHLLGVATKDVRIISLKSSQNKDLAIAASNQLSQIMPHKHRLEVRELASFSDHGQQVWRVAWNVIGTTLASSGDDGTVRMWKANYLDNWKNVAVLKNDSSNIINKTMRYDDSATPKARFYKLATSNQTVPWM